MKILTSLAPLVLLLFCFACSRPLGSSKKKTLHKFKVHTLTEHVAEHGEPEKVKEKSEDPQETKVYVYKDQEYQVDGVTVVAAIRVPQGEEIYLQHWLQELQGYTCHWQDVASTGHQDGEKQYVCHEGGLTLVYDSETDRVIKVVEYESR